MYGSEERLRPFEKRSKSVGGPSFRQLDEVAAEDRQVRRRLRWAIAGAATVHALLFVVSFPDFEPQPLAAGTRSQQAYVVQQVRFRPPSQPQQQPLPRQKTRKIPVPDPTPDDPEPIRVPEQIEPAARDLPTMDDYFLSDLPFGPPGPPSLGGMGVLQVAGDVLPPVKVYAPTPTYTEEARAARVQGVVILQAIIDTAGAVASVKVLKGLPYELSDRAVEVVKTWRFEPATLNGRAVPVYYNLTISFSLQ